MPETPPRPEPWDRQPGEPTRWFARFERYRMAGSGRSLLGAVNAEQADKGGQKRTKVSGAWDQAFARWRWRQRAEAWDDQQRDKARETHAQEIAEMNNRHIRESQALQAKAIARLNSLTEGDLTATEVVRFLIEATKLERTARGEPETIEERRLTGKGGGAMSFSLEDALAAEKELETWKDDRVQPTGGAAVPEGDPEVP
jgi:hypothetical protein